MSRAQILHEFQSEEKNAHSGTGRRADGVGSAKIQRKSLNHKSNYCGAT